MTLRLGILVFPGFQQHGLTGVLEVFTAATGAEAVLIWKERQPVTASGGLVIEPTATFASCAPLDALCILGGLGIGALLDDSEVVDFVRERAPGLRFVSAVSCGALLLGAAGVLRGKRATTHWLSYDFLDRFGATPVDERMVQDGNVITTNNLPSGIDLALRVVAGLAGQAEADTIQLMLEHAPTDPTCSAVIGVSPAVLMDAESRLSDLRRQRETALRRVTVLDMATSRGLTPRSNATGHMAEPEAEMRRVR